MKFGNSRTLYTLLICFALLCPDLLVSVAQAQTKSFGEQMLDSLGIFLYAFIILIVGGFTGFYGKRVIVGGFNGF